MTGSQQDEDMMPCRETINRVQGSAKEWSLGCVKRAPVARGGHDAGITQPRDHSLADPCSRVVVLHPPSHPGRRSLDTMEAEGAISKVSGSHSSRADSIFHGFPSKSEQECSCLMRHFTRPNIFWQLPTCRDGKNCGSHVGHVLLTISELNCMSLVCHHLFYCTPLTLGISSYSHCGVV